jgi:hypothetical protein
MRYEISSIKESYFKTSVIDVFIGVREVLFLALEIIPL